MSWVTTLQAAEKLRLRRTSVRARPRADRAFYFSPESASADDRALPQNTILSNLFCRTGTTPNFIIS
jgi:hypothetical protein